MKNNYRNRFQVLGRHLLVAALLFSSTVVFSQILPTGSSTIGTTVTYRIQDDQVYPSYYWTAVNGNVGTAYRSGTWYYCPVTWTGAGSNTVSFYANGSLAASQVISVSCATVAVPAPTFSAASSTCAPRAVSYTGAPASGITWYWQTDPAGMDMSNSTTSYSALGSATLYVRAVDGWGCWSNGAASYAVTVDARPASPSAPSVSTNTCGVKTLTRSTPPAGVTWYWQDTNMNGTSTSNSSSTYTVATTASYYIGAQNNTSGCWNASNSWNYVTINDPPAPNVPTTTSNSCGPQTVSVSGTPPSNVTWYWQGTNSSGTSTSYPYTSSYSATSSGTYYLRAYSTTYGCWSQTSTSVSVTVSPYAQTPNATLTVSTNACGPKTVTISGTPPANEAWHWQGTNSNGTTINSNTTQTVTTSGTYYLRGLYVSNGCWSVSSQSIAINVTDPPAAPGASNTSVCGSGTMTATPGSGGNDVRWYTAASGGTYTSGTTSPSTSTTTTYYITTYNTSNGCETPTRTAVTLTVNPVPAAPTGQGTSLCGSGTVTATPGTNGNTVKWYDAFTGGSLLATNTTSPVTTTTTNYYITSYNTSTLCESTSPRLLVPVPVNPIPAAPNVSNTTICTSGTMTGTPGSNGDNLRWYTAASGGTFSLGTTSPSVSSTTTWYVVTFSTSTYCESTPRTQVTLTINSRPVVTAPASTVLTYGNPVTLSTSSFYSYQWKRNGVDISGATQQNFVVDGAGDITVATRTASGAVVCESTPINFTTTRTAQPMPVNSVSTTVIMKEGVTENTSLYALNAGEVVQTISYQDGIGRTFQSVGVGLGPDRGDLVTAAGFGKQGVNETGYLPYNSGTMDGRVKIYALRDASGNYNQSAQYQFYQNTAKVQQDAYPYSKSVYKDDPSARVIEQGAPGVDWQPGATPMTGLHTVKSVIALNNASYPVRLWNADGTSSGTYALKSVIVSITTDENGNKVRTYTNKLGQTVLKQVQLDETINGTMTSWLETYYIYNEFGSLKYQLPPAAVKLLNTNTALTADDASVAELIYKYTYDQRGRLVEKKVPGAVLQYLVYDNLDRLCFTQDGAQRSSNKWAFVKYDVKGRAVYTGLYASANDRTTLQSTMNAIDYNSVIWYETESANGTQGYTNTVFPTTIDKLLSVTYYDHYDFDRNGSADYTYDNTHLTGIPAAANLNTRGLATGSKKATIDAAGTVDNTNWLVSVVFYDQYGRPVQTQSNNHLNLTVADKASVLYNFIGKALQTKTTHNPASGGGNQTTIVKKVTYDHAGRVLKIYQNLNNEPNDQLVAQYNYNALGQVVEKNLHLLYDAQDGQTGVTTADNLVETQYNGESQLVARNMIQLLPNYSVKAGATSWSARLTTVTQAQAEANGRYLQSIDYRYNIRGWLKSINNVQLTNDATANDDANDYFGMELVYNTAESGLNNTLYYNGNISAVKWKTVNSDVPLEGTDGRNAFKYTYDKSDKLKLAEFRAHDAATSWSKRTDALNEGISYDHNGNILSLTRNQNQRGLSGLSITSAAQTVDNLSYTYTSGNQLNKVHDNSGNTTGFTDGPTNSGSTNEYTYATDGSLTKDDNKGISSITYNILGKPRQITFTNGNVVNYTYDASGTKLKNATTVSGTTTTTDYVNSFVYTNNNLSFFSSPEGRVVKNGSNLEYQYAIADHQGNTRVVFTSAAPAATPTLANFDGDTNDQSSQFTSVSAPIPYSAANHTPGGSYVVRMNQSTPVGPSLSKKVYPGDKVDMEVWSYYEAGSGYGTSNTGLTGMISSISNVLIASTGGVDAGGLKSSGVNSALTNFGVGANQGDNAPAAFLNYILFDANYKVMDAGWQVVPATAFSKQQVSIPTITVKQAGYIFVYLSYEDQSDNWVYFDDFKVTVTPTNIVQSNEYYSHGLLTANSWTRDGSSNNFLANGATELNATTSLYDLDFRNFDPVLGRMNGVDMMASKYSSVSPYHYSFNNPVSFNDPSGADPLYENLYYYNRALNSGGSIANVRPVDPGTAGGHVYVGSGNNWADQYHSKEFNLATMFVPTFEKFYNVSFKNPDDVWDLAQDLAKPVSVAEFHPGSGVTPGVWVAGKGFINAKEFVKQAGLLNLALYNLRQQTQSSVAFAGPGIGPVQDDPMDYRPVMNTPNVFIFVASTPATKGLTIEMALGTIFDDKGNIVDQFGQVRITGELPWTGSPARDLDIPKEITQGMQDMVSGAAIYRGADPGSESVLSKYIDLIFTYDPSKGPLWNPFYHPRPNLQNGAPHR